ncbi:hypothetical protein DL768_010513 [Monosporascus sp. mg162]|nr:hypothetical protein DL768_010513 [Monosporascus sp. mg162]
MRSQLIRGPRKTTSPESAVAPPLQRKRKASPSLKNAVSTDAEKDLTSGSDKEIPATRGSQKTIGYTRVPDTGEAHDAKGPLQKQRPVEPKRVIDLSADDDAFPSYDAFTEPCNGGWVDAAWTGTYELFGCSVTATEVKIAGFRSSLNHYQAMYIFLLFTNPVREGVAGGLLADDMGLGKTIESLAVVVVRRRLLQSQDYVRDNPYQHLRKDDQSTGIKCPSRYEHPDGLQCTCNRHGWAYKIVRKLYDLPAVIFMPPHLIDNWIDQVKEHLDFGVISPIKDMKFMVNYDAWYNTQGKAKGNQKFVCRKDQVDSAARDKRGCFKEYDNGSLAYYFASEYIKGKGRFHDEITIGLVIMDEAHKYKGISFPTALFVFLDKIRRYV